jgi:hypothetical protein
MTLSVILNVVLLISNIVVYFTQRTTIKHLRIRNAELERTNKASLDLSEGTNKSLLAFKEAVKIEDIQDIIDLKVAAQLHAAVDEVISATAKTMVEDARVLERAIEMINDDVLTFFKSSVSFVMYIMFQLNFSEEAIRTTAKTFFKEHPNADKLLLEEMVRLKLKYPNGISAPDKQIAR